MYAPGVNRPGLRHEHSLGNGVEMRQETVGKSLSRMETLVTGPLIEHGTRVGCISACGSSSSKLAGRKPEGQRSPHAENTYPADRASHMRPTLAVAYASDCTDCNVTYANCDANAKTFADHQRCADNYERCNKRCDKEEESSRSSSDGRAVK